MSSLNWEIGASSLLFSCYLSDRLVPECSQTICDSNSASTLELAQVTLFNQAYIVALLLVQLAGVVVLLVHLILVLVVLSAVVLPLVILIGSCQAASIKFICL